MLLIFAFCLELCFGIPSPSESANPVQRLQQESLLPPQWFSIGDESAVSPLRLGMEKEGVRIFRALMYMSEVLSFHGPNDEGIWLVVRNKVKIVYTLNDLKGWVEIKSPDQALRYVRFLTSPETAHLMRWEPPRKRNPRLFEIVDAAEMYCVPAYGQGYRQHDSRAPENLLPPERATTTHQYWRYNETSREFEKIEWAVTEAGKYTEKVIQRSPAPKTKDYGDGTAGFVNSRAFRAAGFTHPKIVRTKQGFQIDRWIFFREVASDWTNLDAQLIREIVTPEGGYKRSVLRKRKANRYARHGIHLRMLELDTTTMPFVAHYSELKR